MTTVTSKQANPAPAATQPPTDEQLGDLASQRDAANTKIADLDDKLARIDTAVKDPKLADKKGELLELKKRFTAERKTEVNKRDFAQKKLDGTFAQVGGKGTSREVAANEFTKLNQIDKEIADTKSAQSTAVTAFSNATNEYEQAAKQHGLLSPQAKAAEQKAVGAERALDQLDRRLASLQHARGAVASELDSTERKAFGEAKKAGDSSVQDVGDFSQLSTTARQKQLQAVGAPVVGVSDQQAVDSSLSQLTLAGAKGGYRDEKAGRMAKLFNQQLKVASPEAQAALVKGAAARPDLLPEMAKMAQDRAVAAEPVLDALKTAQGPAQTALATEVAKSTTSMDSQLVKSLDARLQNGDGFDEAYALEKGLKAAGKPELAQQVADLSRTRLNEITQDFASKGEAAAAAKGDLARLIAGFGPLLPADKQQAAVDAFKSRHQSEFDAWEAAGSKLARASNFVMNNASWNEKAADLLPDALTTKTGQNLINSAIKDQAKGVKTFLDAGPEAMKDSTKIAKYLPQLIVKSVGQESLSLARAGKTDEAKKVLEGLKNNAGLVGMEPGKVDKITQQLKGVIDGEPNALKRFDTELRGAKPSAGVASALKVFAWGASIVNGVNRGLSNDDLKSSVKASAEILGPTGEMAAATVQSLAESERALLSTIGTSAGAKNVALLGKGLGAVGTGLGAALDAISSVQSFAKGETVEGSISAAQAIGGATLAVDSFGAALGMQVVPVWGQIAGAALVIGGTIGKWAWAEHKANEAEKASEADAKAYLQAAGIPEPAANELKDIKRADGRNVGMMIQQLAPALGMDPKELLAKVMKLPPKKMSDFIDMTKDLKLDDKGKIVSERQAYDSPDHHSETNGDVSMSFKPRSLGTAVEWSKKFFADNGV